MDNNDPLLLGRVRAVTQLDNKQQIIQAVWSDALGIKKNSPGDENDIPEQYKWTTKDPFLCLPFIPIFFNQQPQIKESVNIIYADKEFPYQNKYYVQGSFSSPTMIKNETYLSSRKYTSQGTQIKSLPDIKKQGTNDYYNEYSRGVFPEPQDNAILGRGTSDILLKENELILRAGRNIPQKPNQLPKYNDKRSFFQLSSYQLQEKQEGNKVVTKVTSGSPQVRFLLEWSILNASNQFNLFTGTVMLYQIKDDSPSLRNLTFTVTTEVAQSDITLITVYSFANQPKEVAVQNINNIIRKLNDEGKITTEQNITISLPNVFPLVFRPNKLTYEWITTKDIAVFPSEFNNVSYFNNNIKLQESDKNSGFGILYSKNSFDKPVQVTKEEYIKKSVSQNNQTVGIMGGDKLIFMSHNSAIPNLGKINIDKTVYGIDQNVMNSELIPKTNSMVRGEELMELMELIVQFLITHVHSFPGLPPVPVGTTGIQAQEILNKIRNAQDNILNKNIRIN